MNTKYPKIGIRPIIDGRQGGIRESLEEKTMSLAKAVADLSFSLFKGNANPILGTSWILDNNKAVRIHYKPITSSNLNEIRK